MTSAEAHFQKIVEQAERDPNLIGLYLSGSRGKGFETEHSDWDVRLVFRDGTSNEAIQAYQSYGDHPDFELGMSTLSGLRGYAVLDGEFAWDRYSFAHLTAHIDKVGEVQPIIDAKGRLPDDRRIPYVRDALDGYLNSVYRSLKCCRARNRLGMKLEAIAGIPALLATIFGLEGRHAPYLGYLERELRSYPLQSFPLNPEALLEAITTLADKADVTVQQRLLRALEVPCCEAAMADVFEVWGDAYPWMKMYKPQRCRQ